MKKIFLVLIALLAIGISISAVSAEGFSFSFGTETNSDGGDISIDNDKLSIQGIDFKIPSGYKENETARLVANDSDAFGGSKVTGTNLIKDNDTILVQVFFLKDGEIENVTGENEKTIAGHEGFITEKEDSIVFDFSKDGKVAEIVASSEADIESILS